MSNEQMGAVDEVDLEEYARRGEQPPPAQRYVLRVDRQRIVVTAPTITGAEILALAQKSSDTHKLYQHVRGQQPALVAPTATVDLTARGVERFTTMPKDTTDGAPMAIALRREFAMPSADETYLDGLGLRWETVLDGQSRWLLLHGWSVPDGYNAVNVSLAFLIPSNYSDSQIDMVYVRPAIARADGRAIGALSDQAIKGEVWQRWSRHRTTANPWRPGEDDVASHLTLVDEWFRRELAKV
jgi:hypothetical protein